MRFKATALAAALAIGLSFGPLQDMARAATPARVQVSGEVIASWCYLTEAMYPEGSAHHLCAIWCAAGGIPVAIKGDDGKVYFVLKLGDDSSSVANPGVLEIQSHQVTVEGDLYVRDGLNYLLISQVVSDAGVVNLTHEDYGIQPFGE